MKNLFVRFTGFTAAILLLTISPLPAQVAGGGGGTPDLVMLTTSLSSDIKPLPVLAVMQRVADWQLANPVLNSTEGWIHAAGDAGFMALAGISGDAKYRDAMLA